jgi:hypothetical protein
VFADEVVPGDSARMDRAGDHGCAEGLRYRRELKEGVSIDGFRGAHAAHAEALCVNHRVPLHHANRDAWETRCVQTSAHDALDPGDRFGDRVRRDLPRVGGAGRRIGAGHGLLRGGVGG